MAEDLEETQAPIIAWGVMEFGEPHGEDKHRHYAVVALTPDAFREMSQDDRLVSVIPAAPGTIGTWAKADPKDDYDSLVYVTFDGGEFRYVMNSEYAERAVTAPTARRSNDPMVK
jgi:hypothetical protein